jgi:Uma2 family endonuclease
MATLSKSMAERNPPVTVEQWGQLDGETRYDLIDGHLRERPEVAFWHEILLSPTNELEDRVEKFCEYAGLGVQEYWIDRMIESFGH